MQREHGSEIVQRAKHPAPIRTGPEGGMKIWGRARPKLYRAVSALKVSQVKE